MKRIPRFGFRTESSEPCRVCQTLKRLPHQVVLQASMLQFGVCNFSSKSETFDEPAVMRAERVSYETSGGTLLAVGKLGPGA